VGRSERIVLTRSEARDLAVDIDLVIDAVDVLRFQDLAFRLAEHHRRLWALLDR
jgi:hypothetical protein